MTRTPDTERAMGRVLEAVASSILASSVLAETISREGYTDTAQGLMAATLIYKRAVDHVFTVVMGDTPEGVAASAQTDGG